MIFQAKTQAIFFLLNWVPEAAGVVALASDVVVDAEALGHGHQVLDPPWLGFSSLNHLIFQSYMYPMLWEIEYNDSICSYSV